MIADAINDQVGLDVDRRRIDLKGAIKTAGEHEALVSLYRDIKATLNVLVGDAASFAAAADEDAKAEADAEAETAEEVAAVNEAEEAAADAE